MITCKEDLYKTYIKNDKGLLRELYVNACHKYGIPADAHLESKLIFVSSESNTLQGWNNVSSFFSRSNVGDGHSGFEELTIHDFNTIKNYTPITKGMEDLCTSLLDNTGNDSDKVILSVGAAKTLASNNLKLNLMCEELDRLIEEVYKLKSELKDTVCSSDPLKGCMITDYSVYRAKYEG